MTRPNRTSTTLAATIAALALGTTAAHAADAGAPAINAVPTPAAIAPGGSITSVVQETERSGWPHSPTANEAADIADLALWYASTTAGPRARTAVRCYFGLTFRGAYCGVTSRGPRGRVAYRWNVRVWEDGSYRFTRP